MQRKGERSGLTPATFTIAAAGLVVMVQIGACGRTHGVPAGGDAVQAAAQPDRPGSPAPSAQPAPTVQAQTRSANGYAPAKGALDGRLSALRQMYESTEWPASTAEEIGALLGHDPAACWSFIRSSLRYEPYSGILRGARGALAAGGGNSADLSLLLRAMVRTADAPQIRFAIAELSPETAASLVDRATRAPPARPGPLAARAGGSMPDVTRASEEAAVRSLRAHGTAYMQLLELVRADRRQIEALLATRDAPAGAKDRERAIGAARTHVWLQVNRNGEWQSFDPAAGMALPAQDVRTLDELPAQWHHALNLRIEIERLTGARLEREQAFGDSWTIAELEGRAVEIAISPAALSIEQLLARDQDVRPLIDRAGKDFSRFTMSVALTGAAGVSAGAFDMSGAVFAAGSSGPLGGGRIDVFGRVRRLRPDARPEARLAGVWLTMSLTHSGATTRTVERALLDRIGPAARAEGRLAVGADWSDPGVTSLALVQRHQLLAASGAIGLERPAREALKAVATGGVLGEALALQYEQRGGAPVEAFRKIALPEYPTGLIHMSDGALSLSAAPLVSRGIAYLSEPNLYMRSERLAVDDGRRLRQRTLVDIAVHGLTVLADPALVVESKVLHGLLLSELEIDALRPAGQDPRTRDSAAEVLRDARTQGIELRVVRTPADLAAITADPDARTVMASQLGNGQALLVPIRPVTSGGRARTAWWRLDSFGSVLAMGADGRGQAVSEGMLVLEHISIPSVERTMKFTACFNEAIAAGGSVRGAGAECMSEVVYDIVAYSLDQAIERYIKEPFSDAMDDARAEILGEEYNALYEQAKEAWEKYEEVQGALEQGQGARRAGQRIGGALGFRLYLMLSMGRDIAAFASKL